MPTGEALSLIKCPSPFPNKVLGENVDGFAPEMAEMARRFDPGFDAARVYLRPSRGKKYFGLTLTVTATSRMQLDALYLALSSHPMVKVLL